MSLEPAHQSGDPLEAHSVALSDELGINAGCAVGLARDAVDVADAIEQCPIALGAGRRRRGRSSEGSADRPLRCTMPCSQIPQAYLARAVMITRNCVGMMFRRSLCSSRIFTISTQPHGESRIFGLSNLPAMILNCRPCGVNRRAHRATLARAAGPARRSWRPAARCSCLGHTLTPTEIIFLLRPEDQPATIPTSSLCNCAKCSADISKIGSYIKEFR